MIIIKTLLIIIVAIVAFYTIITLFFIVFGNFILSLFDEKDFRKLKK